MNETGRSSTAPDCGMVDRQTETAERRSAFVSATTFSMSVLVSWTAAAFVMSEIEAPIAAAEGAGAALAARLAIVLAASALLAWLAPRARRVEMALVIGVVWLALAVAVEIVATVNTGHAWHQLLSETGSGWSYDLSILAWFAGPLLFADDDA
jgi:hypothetical protein